jgi:hypothetical protein
LKKKTVYMHAQIMGFPDSEIDHRDRNGLNNQRNNLRLATRQQQAANSEWKRPNGYRGIWKKGNRWIARITVDLKGRYLGSFKTGEEAAAAYDAAALAAFGEFSVLNFPTKQPTPKEIL